MKFFPFRLKGQNDSNRIALEIVSGALNYTRVKTLRKYAYLNILKILPPKNKIFRLKKKTQFFSYFCSTNRLWVLVRKPTVYVIDRNKKNNVYKGVKIIYACFRDES